MKLKTLDQTELCFSLVYSELQYTSVLCCPTVHYKAVKRQLVNNSGICQNKRPPVLLILISAIFCLCLVFFYWSLSHKTVLIRVGLAEIFFLKARLGTGSVLLIVCLNTSAKSPISYAKGSTQSKLGFCL